MDYKREIIKCINSISGSRSPYEVFCDWMRCSALCIENQSQFRHGEIWKRREEEYMNTIKAYGDNAKNIEALFAKMTFYLLPGAMDENLSDTLGEIYMEAGIGNKSTGQFFTPFHVGYMCAQTAMAEQIAQWDGKRIFSMNEPSCGAGGMIIAAAKVMLDNKINPQRFLRVVAQDLDWKAVYMCYVQLSLLGIKALVVQGDVLAEPYAPGYPEDRVLRTPRQKGLLL